jgi:hypothetical protein
LTAARTNEGPYESLLLHNTDGIPSQSPPVATDLSVHYDRERLKQKRRAAFNASAWICVKSGEFLKHYNGYPIR